MALLVSEVIIIYTFSARLVICGAMIGMTLTCCVACTVEAHIINPSVIHSEKLRHLLQ